MDAVIRAAGDDDRTRVGRVMADAFATTPDLIWIEPDPDARAALLRALVGPVFDFSREHGQVEVIEARGAVVGATIWWPYHADETPDLNAAYVVMLSHAVEHLSPRAGKRLAELAGHMGSHYPQLPAYQYLAYIGVLRHRQSQLYGSALLAHRLRQLDDAGQSAYLVASSPSSRDLFTRHGFTVCDGSPFDLPRNGPPLWGMLREPTPPAP